MKILQTNGRQVITEAHLSQQHQPDRGRTKIMNTNNIESLTVQHICSFVLFAEATWQQTSWHKYTDDCFCKHEKNPHIPVISKYIIFNFHFFHLWYDTCSHIYVGVLDSGNIGIYLYFYECILVLTFLEVWGWGIEFLSVRHKPDSPSGLPASIAPWWHQLCLGSSGYTIHSAAGSKPGRTTCRQIRLYSVKIHK